MGTKSFKELDHEFRMAKLAQEGSVQLRALRNELIFALLFLGVLGMLVYSAILGWPDAPGVSLFSAALLTLIGGRKFKLSTIFSRLPGSSSTEGESD